MAADARACVDYELADLVGDLLEVIDLQLAKVCRGIYFGQKSHQDRKS